MQGKFKNVTWDTKNVTNTEFTSFFTPGIIGQRTTLDTPVVEKMTNDTRIMPKVNLNCKLIKYKYNHLTDMCVAFCPKYTKEVNGACLGFQQLTEIGDWEKVKTRSKEADLPLVLYINKEPEKDPDTVFNHLIKDSLNIFAIDYPAEAYYVMIMGNEFSADNMDHIFRQLHLQAHRFGQLQFLKYDGDSVDKIPIKCKFDDEYVPAN